MSSAVPLAGFPGYLAGRDGHIYSVRLSSKRVRLAEGEDRDGYVTVQLTYARKSRAHRVHKLIASAFVGPAPLRGLQLRHFDGCKANNTPTNLLWGTALENAKDRERHGRTARGERNKGGRNKLTPETVREIRLRLKAGASTYAVAREFKISQGMAWFVKTGRKWGHVT